MTAAAVSVTGHRNVGLERQRAWQVAWPIGILCLAMPPMFVIGAHAFLWLLPAFVFGPALLMRHHVRLPPAAVTLALFLVFVALGVLQMQSFPSLVVFAYRFLVFVSMFVSFVWVYQLSPWDLSSERLVRWLAGLWLIMIGFGILGVLLGTVVDTLSPIQRVLPSALSRDEFLDSLSAWRFAEVQRIGGVAVPRPSAPLPYTNGWGSTVALLTPFFFRSWLESANARRRRLGWAIAVVALVPITFSLNRGLFLSIGICLMWASWTRLREGDPRWLIRTAVVVLAVVVAFMVTPLGTLVDARLNQTQNSNAARASVYELAWQGSWESPIVGHGAPRVVPGLPPIGTHGLVWYLMYSHGFVALTLFVGSFLFLFMIGGRTRTQEGRWARAVLLIGLVQFLIYGLLPQVVLLGIAAGLMCRDSLRWAPPTIRAGARRGPVTVAPAESMARSGDALVNVPRRRSSVLDRL